MSCHDCTGTIRATPPMGTFQVGWRERAALAIVRMATPIIGTSHWRWVWMRWDGMPWPLRRAAAMLSPRFRRQNWPGCGCIVSLRDAVDLVRTFAGLDSLRDRK